MSLKKIPILDGLRAVSILLVLFGHGVHEIPALTGFGRHLSLFGVRVFFVISGFLITSILASELSFTGSLSLKRFYARRAWRLMPAFYLYLLVMAGLAALGMVVIHLNDFAFAITYTTNFYKDGSWDLGHFWTLANEEQFYLLWPLILSMTGVQRAPVALIVAVILGPVSRILIAEVGLDTNYNTVFPAVCDALAMGCLLALFRKNLHKKAYLKLLRSGMYMALVPLAFLAELPMPRLLAIAIGPTLVSASIAIMIDGLITFDQTWVGKMLQWPFVALIGSMSYSIYIWQQFFLDPFSRHWWNQVYLKFPLTFAAAAFSYWLVEQPFQKMGQRLIQSSIRAKCKG